MFLSWWRHTRRLIREVVTRVTPGDDQPCGSNPAGTLPSLQLCQDAHRLTLQDRFRGVGHTTCSCVSTRQYTPAKDVHVKKVYEDANLQNGDGRSQMWSGFPRRLYASAQDWGQVLLIGGKSCSHGRAFTTHSFMLVF